MSLQTEFPTRLIPLFDGRPGLRGTIQVETCTPPAADPSPSPRGEGRGEGELPTASPISENSCNSCLDFISSDSTLDRYQEIIAPEGWRLDNYRLNPVFQNAHQYGDIIFTLGRALITEVRALAPPKPGEAGYTPHSALPTPHLYQRIQFATDANPMARIAYALYAGKFLNAVSVGFIPLRWENADGSINQIERTAAAAVPAPLSSPGGERQGEEAPSLRTPHSALPTQNFRRRYLEQELLEVSAVAIPANPNALALAYKSGAVPKTDLRDTLDLLRQLTTEAITPINPISPITPIPSLHSLLHQLRALLRS